MNSYYHEFQIGFNWWFVVAPLLAVVMVAIGLSIFHMDERTLKIRRSYNDRLFVVLATLFAVVVMVLIFAESSDGIVQWFDNGLGKNESPVWSIVMMPFPVICLSGLYWMLLIVLGKLGAYIKCGYLHEKRQEILAEERRKNRRG